MPEWCIYAVPGEIFSCSSASSIESTLPLGLSMTVPVDAASDCVKLASKTAALETTIH